MLFCQRTGSLLFHHNILLTASILPGVVLMRIILKINATASLIARMDLSTHHMELGLNRGRIPFLVLNILAQFVFEIFSKLSSDLIRSPTF